MSVENSLELIRKQAIYSLRNSRSNHADYQLYAAVKFLPTATITESVSVTYIGLR
jgi:hypothetical protein